MAVKKKQHFVPKFYLKNFSTNLDQTHIGLYHIPSKNFIVEADLSNQAYDDYFYGKDGIIENNLSELENKARHPLKEVINKKSLPSKNSEDYLVIWAFTLIQDGRTFAQAKEMNESINSQLKEVMKHDITVKDKIDGLVFKLKDAPVFTLSVLQSVMYTARDLSCKLIYNKTNLPFITSDHPVVKYNQFLENRKFDGGRTGLATKGLQLFFPIHPNFLLLFYDSKVYKVGGRKRDLITVENEDEINNMNLLQSLNCDEILYFNKSINKNYLEILIQNRERFYVKNRHVTEKVGTDVKPNGDIGELFRTYYIDIGIKLNLSFIKETDHAKKFKFTGYAVELRDESLRGTMHNF
jgi:hypothetical protein